MSSLIEETSVYKGQIDEWIKFLGLPQHQPANKDIEKVLGFTREEIRERSSVELSEDAILLSQYALFLQQKTNECKTFLQWSGPVMKRLDGESRSKLHKWIGKAELRKERIEYLTRRIELVGQSIGGLVRARYNEGKN
jgi:hypothetical protein